MHRLHVQLFYPTGAIICTIILILPDDGFIVVLVFISESDCRWWLMSQPEILNHPWLFAGSGAGSRSLPSWCLSNISVNRATKLYPPTESRTWARPDDPAIIDSKSYHSYRTRGLADTGTQDLVRDMVGYDGIRWDTVGYGWTSAQQASNRQFKRQQGDDVEGRLMVASPSIE